MITHIYSGGTAIVNLEGKLHRRRMNQASYNSLVGYLNILKKNPQHQAVLKKVKALLVPPEFKAKAKAIEQEAAKSKALKSRVKKKTTIEVKKAERELYRGKKMLNEHPWFAFIDGKYYFKPYLNVALPEELVECFASALFKYSQEASDENRKLLKGYVNFWLLCLTNPDPRSRTEAFKYISRNKLIVTENGYLVTFRRVVTTNKVESRTLASQAEMIRGIIDNAYDDLVTRGKNTQHYYIIEQSQAFSVVYKNALKKFPVDVKVHGTVFDLYGQLGDLDFMYITEEVPVYTDNKTKSFRIILGEPVSMPRHECNSDPRVECSRGLHVGTPAYVKGGGYYGDVPVVCLVNPRDIVSVPYADAYKMRVCQYLPFALLEDMQEMLKFDSISLYEHSYKEYEDKALRDKLTAEMNSLVEFYAELETYSQLKKEAQMKDVLDAIKASAVRLEKLRQDANISIKKSEYAHLDADQLALLLKQRKVTL